MESEPKGDESTTPRTNGKDVVDLLREGVRV